jgi:hypothetical protein
MISSQIQSGRHPQNEHYRVDMFQRGIERAMGCLGGLAQLPR